MNLAYIDPGSGSMILQLILGGLAAALVFLKMFWNRVLVFLRIRKPEDVEPRAEASSESDAASFERPLDRAGEPAGKS